MARSARQSDDLHGNVPDRSGAVLLLVDVINDLDFPDNEYLLRVAPRLAQAISRLKQRCEKAGIPVIYANDNKGRWRSDLREVVSCCQKSETGRAFVRELAPGAEDYVVLKPKHSVFLATPLDLMLESVGAHTIIMAGLTTNACILISAAEIHMRGYRLFVPSDCVEALSPEQQKASLKMLKENFGADTRRAASLRLAALKKRA